MSFRLKHGGLLLVQTELIRSKGYPCEDFTVETPDGFLLGLQRIPHGRHGRGSSGGGSSGQPRPVIFLQHGLLCASTNFLTNLANESFGNVFICRVCFLPSNHAWWMSVLLIIWYLVSIPRASPDFFHHLGSPEWFVISSAFNNILSMHVSFTRVFPPGFLSSSPSLSCYWYI